MRDRPRPAGSSGGRRAALIVAILSAAFLSAMSVFVQGAPSAEAATFTLHRDVDVMVVVDSSKRDIPFHSSAILRAAADTVRTMPRNARIGLVTTGPFPAVVRPLTKDRVGTVAAISGVRAEGRAPLFDAISLAIDQFDTNTLPSRTVVVVGDARTSGNSVSLNELLVQLKDQRVTVDFVTVGIGPPNEAVIHALLGPKSSRVGDSELSTLGKQISAAAEVSLKPKSTRRLRIPTATPMVLGALLLMGSVGILAYFFSAPRSTRLNAEGLVLEGSEGNTPVTELSKQLSGVIDRTLERSGRHSSMNLALEAAGVSLKPGEFVLLTICVIIALGGFGYATKGLVGGMIGLMLGILGGFTALRRKARKRRSAFGTQLGDVLQLLSSSMRAGQSLIQSLDAVAKEGESPSSEEFRRVIVETRLGRDLVDSLHALATRMECEDLRWVIPAIEINRSVGGDLGEVLDNVGKTIRDRADVRRQIKTLSAEGRMSAWVLLALPVALGGYMYMTNRDYMSELFHGVGLYLLAIGFVMMVVGTFWMLTLCKIKF